jgi:Transposase zinc-binding domain/Putative transposase
LRTSLEVADIFRAEGAGYRAVQAGHLSLTQLKVMSVIENCRTAALGGHVDACEDCGHQRIAYNSCRNRHCPKCQGAAARIWLAGREADLLPVGYFHVVFTLPTEVADIAGQNRAILYDLLFRVASETMMTIAAEPANRSAWHWSASRPNPKHLGARIGITAVLHTWGSAMTHHPHIHMIVPGGGISLDGRSSQGSACVAGGMLRRERWISSRPAFLLPVRVLGALFRRLFLTRLIELHRAGRLAFFGTRAGLADRRRFLRHLAPVRKNASPRSGQEEAVGGLCQAAVHRSRGRARLSLAQHPPGRHLEPASDWVRRDRRHLPLQGLPPRWSGAAARHDARAA